MQWPKARPRDKRFGLGEPWPSLYKLLHSAASTAAGTDQPIRVRVLRASATGALLKGVMRSIRNADILVFEVTPRGESRRDARINANVLVEIGLALGMGKPVLLIGESSTAYTSLPSDLSGQLVCNYGSVDGQRTIQGHIRSLVRKALRTKRTMKGKR